MQTVDLPDIGTLAVRTAKSVVKNRPVTVSLWAFGLLLSAFASGFAVSPDKLELYDMTIRAAQEVESMELGRAMSELSRAEDRFLRSQGWFSCDRTCEQNRDKYNLALKAAEATKAKRDKITTEARREVGIWSTFGVSDVRAAFWSAWQAGRDWANTVTMFDAMFMAIGGRQETFVGRGIMNLTLGMIGMFFCFVHNVYALIVSYGEPAMSGLVFFLLVLVASLATVVTYLCAIYGTVAGARLYLRKQAAKQKAFDTGNPGFRARQVHYGNQRYDRAHYD